MISFSLLTQIWSGAGEVGTEIKSAVKSPSIAVAAQKTTGRLSRYLVHMHFVSLILLFHPSTDTDLSGMRRSGFFGKKSSHGVRQVQGRRLQPEDEHRRRGDHARNSKHEICTAIKLDIFQEKI